MNNEMKGAKPTLAERLYEMSKEDSVYCTLEKYDADIESLKTTYGELKPGMAIEITLQDLLTICPRNRRRIEAYQGLVTTLRKQGVTLTITSNKTK